MKYIHTIILTLILVTFFCCFFGYCLMRSCRRAVDLEFQEINYMRDVEAQAEGSVSGGAKSKDGSKTRSKSGGAKSAGAKSAEAKSENGQGSKATKSAGSGGGAAKSNAGGDVVG
ncbi:hypothetical protein AG0111_0g4514 [Alternaria gaisen]|uniref:Uncharacterized protein n=1 Tax=Alternaria gaisen TaxID=167740 RepID=A0ACB6FS03_9PLEO|nr:hypothetical protein AG0111_0g4514 [Alternaria gaisen]